MTIKILKRLPSLKKRSLLILIGLETGEVFRDEFRELASEFISSDDLERVLAFIDHELGATRDGDISHLPMYSETVKSVSFVTIDTSRAHSGMMAGVAVQRFSRDKNLKDVVVCRSSLLSLCWESFIQGVLLEDYRFTSYKSDAPKVSPTSFSLIEQERVAKSVIDRCHILAEGTHLARDLVNLCPSECTPKYLATTAQRIAKKYDLGCKVYRPDALKKMGANAILAVGAASQHDALLIRLSYKSGLKKAKKIALVGKGVTYDSGGLSLKPSSSLELMKFDMGGAAAVLGAMQAIARLRPGCDVEAYIPAVENMVAGNATKPGDVVRALNGKFIEILNTDAEGRLILADALALAEEEGADAIVDIATLTGAVVVALGESVAAYFSRDDDLSVLFEETCHDAGEAFWRMPLVQDYSRQLDSKVADIKNISGDRWGGAIIAALFLGNFVKTSKWIHLDIAGTAFSSQQNALSPAGGVGFGVRSLALLVDRWAKQAN
jgi:leucyl aminopeptidase